MLSKSEFDDQLLTQSFYQALFNRFYQSCVRAGDRDNNRALQTLLSECTFGIAPSPTGVQTLFIIAPDQESAQLLTEYVPTLVSCAMEIMGGVNQTAICFVPVEKQAEFKAELRECKPFSPKFLLGKIFAHPPEFENSDDE
ncbi:MAG: hypothetical protein LRZ84_07710 [Desertifilum sp.]|nr:hypothetical protein [Desertifilum sp.]